MFNFGSYLRKAFSALRFLVLLPIFLAIQMKSFFFELLLRPTIEFYVWDVVVVVFIIYLMVLHPIVSRWERIDDKNEKHGIIVTLKKQADATTTTSRTNLHALLMWLIRIDKFS